MGKRELAVELKHSGIRVIFIGTAGAMQGMLTINDDVISSGQSMMVYI